MRIGVSGHRNKYFRDWENEELKLVQKLSHFLNVINVPQENISFTLGGAQGVDAAVARYCIMKDIPFDLYVPFPLTIHCRKWPDPDRFFLLEQHKRCRSKVVVSETFNNRAYQRRNEEIVTNCDLLLTWMKTMNSGTGNCIKYAREVKKPVFHLRTWDPIKLPEVVIKEAIDVEMKELPKKRG